MSDIDPIESLKSQIIDLQSRLAFQEDAINALDRVVAGQQRSIDQLLEHAKGYKDQLDQVRAQLDREEVVERPPHY